MDGFQQVIVCATTHMLHSLAYNSLWVLHKDHFGQLYRLGQAGTERQKGLIL